MEIKSINNWAEYIHDIATKHGWWEEDKQFPEIVALCHSELSEALEEYRNNKPMFYYGERKKPEGIATEMIDCIIRILDWCASANVDVDTVMKDKCLYNESRPYRHGGKRC